MTREARIMTPEERAADILPGPGPLNDAYREALVAAIHAAVLEE
jgi:hypothetical protein